MCTDPREKWLSPALAALDSDHLRRSLRGCPAVGGVIESGGRRILNFSSNDYLGLARHPQVVQAAAEAAACHGAGATSSRLVAGTLELHEALERELADYEGTPSALVFGSGFLTNLGAVGAVVGRSDLVFADRLAHASLIDGIRLCGARLQRFRHNDCAHLAELLAGAPAEGRRLVATESVFSMDGDLAPLAEIAATAARHGAMLLVDEAHSSGIFRASAGLADKPNLLVGTLSKGFGGYGGFVACSDEMREWLINSARSFIYTTGLPPASAAAALAALRIVRGDPTMGERLLRNAQVFRASLAEAGLDTAGSASQIVPVMVGDNGKALALADRLRRRGIIGVAIRPPTVPRGTARLRLSMSLAHEPDDLARAAAEIIAAVREEGQL